MWEILAFAIFTAAFVFWVEAMRAREAALDAAVRACEREGLQFLDAAAACVAIKLARDEHGRLGIRRKYRFEFSDDRYNRKEGIIVMQGRRVVTLTLDPFLL
jgi:hypothetical protein